MGAPATQLERVASRLTKQRTLKPKAQPRPEPTEDQLCEEQERAEIAALLDLLDDKSTTADW
jgi:hypothetical protein